MRKVSIRKLNNQGSTFVMAIIVITLVTMLAVAILAASTNNLAMKNVDRNSKETFYTAETVMDEVCAGTGLDSMKQLGLAYEKVITTLVNQDGSGFEYIIDNEEANTRFKSYFIDYMLKLVTGTLEFEDGKDELLCVDQAILEVQVIPYLTKFIKGYENDMAKILSVGSIEAYKKSDSGRSYMIIIRDVAIQYKEEKNGEIYFSNVTTDLEIQFPNMTVDFSATNRLKDFINYVFIADDNINIRGAYGANAVDLESTASIYAGNLINVNSAGSYTSELYMHSPSNTDNINMICGGNEEIDDEVSGTISLFGSTDAKAIFKAEGTNIWCTNIKIKSNLTTSSGIDVTKGGEITIGSNCNTFVRDDLTIDGQDSKVDLFGEYYGYSSLGSHAESSAIIVNGKRARLNISTSKLLLAGHSYIELTDDVYQMMGEAVSLRGDQEIYLIPSEYLGKNYGVPVPNPMSKDTWDDLYEAANVADSNVKICDMDGFFAMKPGLGYINTTTQYVKREANGLVYLYINFAGANNAQKEANAAKYVYDVANGYNGAPLYLQNILDKYTANLFKEGAEPDNGKFEGFVEIKSDTVYTKGTLINTSSSALSGTGVSIDPDNTVGASSQWDPLGHDGFAITYTDLNNRYKILTHLLADIPWTADGTAGGPKYIVDNPETALSNMKNYWTDPGDLSRTEIFYSIIDKSMFNSRKYNVDKKTFQHNGQEYIKIVTDENVTVGANVGIHGGIVVSSGTVTVTGNFNGMIIAGIDINVENNAIVSNNAAEVEKLILETLDSETYFEEDDVEFREFFRAYKHVATDEDSRDKVIVEEVDYKDIVKVNNWRKYYDYKEESTASE